MTPTIPGGINIELLDKIALHIIEVPTRVFMDDWVIKSYLGQTCRYIPPRSGIHYNTDQLQFPECGMVCCIGGWAIFLSGEKNSDNDYFFPADTERVATRVLRLTENQAHQLFLPTAWPEPFKSRLRQAPLQSLEYAQVVVDRIQAFKEQYT